MADSAQTVSHISLPHKIVLVYAGVLALAWDTLIETTQEPERLLSRGRSLESNLKRQATGLWNNVERAPASLFATARDAVRSPLLRVEKDIAATSAVAEEELEKQVDRALARLGIPSRERILDLGREIEALTARIDRELDRLSAESVYPI